MRFSVVAFGLLCGGVSALCSAQTIDPFYAGSYSATNLGTVAGVPGSYGGLTFKLGDPNTILIGGAANGINGAIYSVPVTRDAVTNQVTGFGTPTLFSTAPNIDGGLDYAPNGVLFYTGYPINSIGQIKPGSTIPDKVTSASPVASSVGTLRFVPAGFPGAGRLKLLSYTAGTWHDASFTPDGIGTYDITIYRVTPDGTVTAFLALFAPLAALLLAGVLPADRLDWLLKILGLVALFSAIWGMLQLVGDPGPRPGS